MLGGGVHILFLNNDEVMKYIKSLPYEVNSEETSTIKSANEKWELELSRITAYLGGTIIVQPNLKRTINLIQIEGLRAVYPKESTKEAEESVRKYYEMIDKLQFP